MNWELANISANTAHSKKQTYNTWRQLSVRVDHFTTFTLSTERVKHSPSHQSNFHGILLPPEVWMVANHTTCGPASSSMTQDMMLQTPLPCSVHVLIVHPRIIPVRRCRLLWKRNHNNLEDKQTLRKSGTHFKKGKMIIYVIRSLKRLCTSRSERHYL